jgi:DNA-binding NarL/FixJ family response regulator
VLSSDLPQINVLLVEDHLALRKGLTLLLRQEGIHVVGETADSDQAVAYADRRAPDVVVLDLGLPGGRGLDVIDRIAALPRPPAILVYTGGGAMLDALIAATGPAVAGIALKVGPISELVGAVRRVASGGTYRDPRLAFEGTPAVRSLILSERERQIVAMLADGLSGAKIARDLAISPETVRTHIRNAMTKLGAATRSHALMLAVRCGELQVPLAA